MLDRLLLSLCSDKEYAISLEQPNHGNIASNPDFTYLFRQEVLEVFRAKDRDMDGKMSFEEFCGQKSRYELAFEAIDKNGDGFVSRHEFKKICPNLSKEQREAAFDKFDKDGTGRINYKEFCSMLTKK